jgi:signal transduction histidine kinase
VSIGQSLNIDLVAEGVEHAEQLELLLEMGCRQMQGYFWSAPVRSGRLLATIDRIARLGGSAVETAVAADAGVDVVSGSTPVSERDAAEQALLLLDHELRNPLTVIAGYLDALEDTEQGPRGQLALAAMRRALVTMTRTLESFGSLHALEASSRPLLTRAIELDDLVHAIVEELTPVVHEKDIRVEVERGQMYAEGDEHATRLILMNLLTNADKYAPPGSSVVVRVSVGETEVAVAVIDDGPGVAPEDTERIFEKFERASTSAKGYGLGLYLSRRLARQQRGDLVYTPVDGGGAAFQLSLPRSLSR